MNEYTDSAVALLAAAVNRRRNARPDELVEEVWKLYDMAEGFGEALAMLALDEGKFHPYTVRGARIVSVSEEKGLQVSWLEPDRDTGQMVPNDAYVGSLYHAWQRAAFRTARDLAGTEATCSIYISYEKQDGYTNSNGQAISWIRRVLRIRPDFVAAHRAQGAAVEEERSPSPRIAEPERSVPAEHVEPPAEQVAPAPQPSFDEAEPSPLTVDTRPADPGLLAFIDTLTAEQRANPATTLDADAVNAYRQAWWNKLPRGTEPTLRRINRDAQRKGRGLRRPQDPETVDDLYRILDLTRVLLAEQGATT